MNTATISPNQTETKTTDTEEMEQKLRHYVFFASLKDLHTRENSDTNYEPQRLTLTEAFSDTFSATIQEVKIDDGECYLLKLTPLSGEENNFLVRVTKKKKGKKENDDEISIEFTLPDESKLENGNAIDRIYEIATNPKFENFTDKALVFINNNAVRIEESLIRQFCIKSSSSKYSSIPQYIGNSSKTTDENAPTSEGELGDTTTNKPVTPLKVEFADKTTEEGIRKISEKIREVFKLQYSVELDYLELQDRIIDLISSVNGLKFGEKFSSNSTQDSINLKESLMAKKEEIMESLSSSFASVIKTEDYSDLIDFISKELLIKFDSIRNLYLNKALYTFELTYYDRDFLKETTAAEVFSQIRIEEGTPTKESLLLSRNRNDSTSGLKPLDLSDKYRQDNSYLLSLKESVAMDIASYNYAHQFHERKESSKESLATKLERFSKIKESLEKEEKYKETLSKALAELNTVDNQFFLTNPESDQNEYTITFDGASLLNRYSEETTETTNTGSKKTSPANAKVIRQNRKFLQDQITKGYDKFQFTITTETENTTPSVSLSCFVSDDDEYETITAENSEYKTNHFDVERLIDYATLRIKFDLAKSIIKRLPKKTEGILSGLSLDENFKYSPQEIKEFLETQYSADNNLLIKSLLLFKPEALFTKLKELDEKLNQETLEKLAKVFEQANSIVEKRGNDENADKSLRKEGSELFFTLKIDTDPAAEYVFHIEREKISIILPDKPTTILDPLTESDLLLLNQVAESIDALYKQESVQSTSKISGLLDKIIGKKSELTLSKDKENENENENENKYYISFVSPQKENDMISISDQNDPLSDENAEEPTLVPEESSQEGEDLSQILYAGQNESITSESDNTIHALLPDQPEKKTLTIEGIGTIVLKHVSTKNDGSKEYSINVEYNETRDPDLAVIGRAEKILESYAASQELLIDSYKSKCGELSERIDEIAYLSSDPQSTSTHPETTDPKLEDTFEDYDLNTTNNPLRESQALASNAVAAADTAEHSQENPTSGSQESASDPVAAADPEEPNSLYDKIESLVKELSELESKLSQKKSLFEDFKEAIAPNETSTNQDTQDNANSNEAGAIKATWPESKLSTKIENLSDTAKKLEEDILESLKTELTSFIETSEGLFPQQDFSSYHGDQKFIEVPLEIEEQEEPEKTKKKLTLKIANKSISFSSEVIDNENTTHNDVDDSASSNGNEVKTLQLAILEGRIINAAEAPLAKVKDHSSSEIFVSYQKTALAVCNFIQEFHKSKSQEIVHQIFEDDETRQSFKSGQLNIEIDHPNITVTLQEQAKTFDLSDLKINNDSVALSESLKKITTEQKLTISSSQELLEKVEERKTFLNKEIQTFAGDNTERKEESLKRLNSHYTYLLDEKLEALGNTLLDCKPKGLLVGIEGLTKIENSDNYFFSIDDENHNNSLIISFSTNGEISITPTNTGADYDAKTLMALGERLKEQQKNYQTTYENLFAQLGNLKLFETVEGADGVYKYKVTRYTTLGEGVYDPINNPGSNFDPPQITTTDPDPRNTFKVYLEGRDYDITEYDPTNSIIEFAVLGELAKSVQKTGECETSYLEKIERNTAVGETGLYSQLEEERETKEKQLSSINNNLALLLSGTSGKDSRLTDLCSDRENGEVSAGTYCAKYFRTLFHHSTAEKTLRSHSNQLLEAKEKIEGFQQTIQGFFNTPASLFKCEKTQNENVTSETYSYKGPGQEDKVVITLSYSLSDTNTLPSVSITNNIRIPSTNESTELYCANGEDLVKKVQETIEEASKHKSFLKAMTEKLDVREGLLHNRVIKIPSNGLLELKRMWNTFSKLLESGRLAFADDSHFTLKREEKAALNKLIDAIIDHDTKNSNTLNIKKDESNPVATFAQIYRTLRNQKKDAATEITEIYESLIKDLRILPKPSLKPQQSARLGAPTAAAKPEPQGRS